MNLNIKFKILFLFTVALLIATGLNLLFMSRVLKENSVEALRSELLAQANSLKSQFFKEFRFICQAKYGGYTQ